MKALIDESRTLYAAIQARCPDAPAERFVISYTSEEALRDLLATPSILASGCTTRERAEELCCEVIPTRNIGTQEPPYATAGRIFSTLGWLHEFQITSPAIDTATAFRQPSDFNWDTQTVTITEGLVGL